MPGLRVAPEATSGEVLVGHTERPCAVVRARLEEPRGPGGRIRRPVRGHGAVGVRRVAGLEVRRVAARGDDANAGSAAAYDVAPGGALSSHDRRVGFGRDDGDRCAAGACRTGWPCGACRAGRTCRACRAGDGRVGARRACRAVAPARAAPRRACRTGWACRAFSTLPALRDLQGRLPRGPCGPTGPAGPAGRRSRGAAAPGVPVTCQTGRACWACRTRRTRSVRTGRAGCAGGTSGTGRACGARRTGGRPCDLDLSCSAGAVSQLKSRRVSASPFVSMQPNWGAWACPAPDAPTSSRCRREQPRCSRR